jgi:large repetitive protein
MANTSTTLAVTGGVPGNGTSSYGESLTLKATVANTSNSTYTPTGGTVTYYSTINSVQTILGTANMVKGTATLTTTGVGAGTGTFTATYSGVTNFAASTTATGTTQTVNTANTSTTVAAHGNPSSPNYGETLNYIASVTDTSDPSVLFLGAEGSFTFYDGATKLGTISAYNGTATLPTAQVLAGTNSITAVYNGFTNPANGQANFAASPASAALTQKVGTASTSVMLVASSGNSNPSTYGVPLTFTATVTDTSPGDSSIIPQTGTITLYNGSTKLASFGIENGKASFTLPNSAFGFQALAVSSTPYSITAVYTAPNNANGVPDFNTSTSTAVTQTVNTEASTSTLVTTAAPTQAGQLVTITATISNTASGSVVIPVGTVTFTDGQNGPVLAVKSVIDGVATLTTKNLSKGTHDIWAYFTDGANNFMASSMDATQVIL